MERKKLLIADDSEMNRAILANILDQDYEIIEAADGREAIAALQVYHREISACFWISSCQKWMVLRCWKKCVPMAGWRKSLS